MPCLAENLPYFSRYMDLNIAYNMVVGTMESIQFEYFNLIPVYMLHTLAESQSMGKLSYAFKNVRKTLMRMTGLSRSSPARPSMKTVLFSSFHKIFLEKHIAIFC